MTPTIARSGVPSKPISSLMSESSNIKKSLETENCVSAVSEDDEELSLVMKAVKIVGGAPAEDEEDRF